MVFRNRDITGLKIGYAVPSHVREMSNAKCASQLVGFLLLSILTRCLIPAGTRRWPRISVLRPSFQAAAIRHCPSRRMFHHDDVIVRLWL